MRSEIFLYGHATGESIQMIAPDEGRDLKDRPMWEIHIQGAQKDPTGKLRLYIAVVRANASLPFLLRQVRKFVNDFITKESLNSKPPFSNLPEVERLVVKTYTAYHRQTNDTA